MFICPKVWTLTNCGDGGVLLTEKIQRPGSAGPGCQSRDQWKEKYFIQKTVRLVLQEGCRQGQAVIVVHGGECNTESVCARLNCHPLASCSSRPGDVVECSCPSCPPVYTPVCGNNNQTYDSQCELYRTVCLTGDSESSREFTAWFCAC